MDPEVRKLLDELNKAVATMRESNDERLKAIEAKGHADPILEEKVNKANTAIDEIYDKIKKIETENARIPAGGDAKARETEASHARQFLALVRNQPIDAIDPDEATVTSLRNYRPAFASYLRRGQINDAMSVGSSPDGGYWVLPDTSGRIVQMIYETSPMRQLASIQPIGTDALEGEYDNDEAASGGWVGENTPRTETGTPQIGKWRIEAAEQYAMPKATQKFLDDSFIDVEAWLANKAAAKLSRVENTAFVSGDGINKPKGFLSYASGNPTKAAFGVIAQTKTGVNGGFAASAPGDLLIDQTEALKKDYRQNATWVGTRTTKAAIRKLKDGQGNYLWVRDFTVESANVLLGHPYVEFSDMPEISSNGLALAFGDFKQGYQVVDRFGIRVLRDPLTQKGFVLFYTTKRTGGGVVNFEALRLIKFST